MPEETSNEKPTTQIVTLPTGGSIPGIPGSHGPGRYIINWIERTLTPAVDAVEGEIARVKKAAGKTSAASAPESEATPAETPATSEQGA